jgi:hypothetical protein
VTPDDVGVRGGDALPLVVPPDMLLNRLVVPRVAPMLELLPEAEEPGEPGVLPDVPELAEPPNAEAPPLDDEELELSLLDPEPEFPLVLTEPELPPPENIRPRSLRLPRICGTMMVANFSAWMVPLTRIVRLKSPSAMPAVRTTVVGAFPGDEPARLVFK